LGIGPNPQSPIPNPQSPIPNSTYFPTLFTIKEINNLLNKIKNKNKKKQFLNV
jgi:hypothetical protein